MLRDIELPGNRAYSWDDLHMSSPMLTIYLLILLALIDMIVVPTRLDVLPLDVGERMLGSCRQFRSYKR